MITKKEKAAIKTLKNLAKRWPKSLWLFSASGTLCVMRNPGSPEYGKGYNPDDIVDYIDIPNDGGDW